MKKLASVLILAFALFLITAIPASAEIYYEGMVSGSTYYGDGAGLEGAPYYPSPMARLDIGAYANGLVYTGDYLTIRYFAPNKMYVNIIDFAPDGYATLLLHNRYIAPGSNSLDWYVEGVAQGQAGREYLYLIVSTDTLSFDDINAIAEDPYSFEPGENIFATDIESFQLLAGAASNGTANTYSPFVDIPGTPLEVYPTYYIFPGDSHYRNPYTYYYFYVPDNLYGGGKYYRARVGVGGHAYYAYPRGGTSYNNLVGLHTSGRIIDDRYEIIPGGYLSGTFQLGTVSNSVGLVIQPYTSGGFYKSYQDWGNDFTFEVWVNGQNQGYGYVVNDANGLPQFYTPVRAENLKEGDNSFELRVPDSGEKIEIERVEIVESDEPEEVQPDNTVQYHATPPH